MYPNLYYIKTDLLKTFVLYTKEIHQLYIFHSIQPNKV